MVESVRTETRAAGVERQDDRPSGPVDLGAAELYFNRELSELEFQKRVLFEALDERNPLLERVRFLGIFTRNMDEFFMKRVGGLKQQVDAGLTETTPDGRTPAAQWAAALATARPMLERQASGYEDGILPALDREGIRIVGFGDLDGGDRERLTAYFEESVFPTLTPLTLDPGHPFPFLSNLSLSLAVLTREQEDAEPSFSRIKIPPALPRLVRIGESSTFVPLESLVAAKLGSLFPGVEVLGSWLFRVTRNAEVRRNEEVAEDLIEVIEKVLRDRRFATAVRLEHQQGMPGRIRELLQEQLGLDEDEFFEIPGPLDYRGFEALAELDRPELEPAPWTPQPHPRVEGAEPRRVADRGGYSDVFDVIRRGDILVHHPYHSFDGTVHRFFQQAARDPRVLAVKSTIYRTGTESKIIESLVEAAHNGKQVAVMVELKARFDEENNLRWVERLEEEGIHVAYGVLGYKTHTKTTLVVRQEDDRVRLYAHVGTGNYHSGTAEMYTDLGLLTADVEIGRDLARLFNLFTARSKYREYEKLLIAPASLRRRMTELIRREAELARGGEGGRIIAKMNSLEDPEIIRELYEASRAGARIDLLVRGLCCLRPGVPGVSDNIRVTSIVGRFLEHSRIFYFGGGGEPHYYIGSADWMTRNLDKRVEAVAPVEDPELREQLRHVLEVSLSDNRRAWELGADGGYRQRRPAPGEAPLDTHERLKDDARRAAAAD